MTRPSYGIYNVTNTGPAQTWASIAADVYEHLGYARGDVTGTSTAAYFKDKSGIAPRPTHSTLDLAKLEATGHTPPLAQQRLAEYLSAWSEA